MNDVKEKQCLEKGKETLIVEQHWLGMLKRCTGCLQGSQIKDPQKDSILSQSLMFLEVDTITRTMLLSCSTEGCGFSSPLNILSQH